MGKRVLYVVIGEDTSNVETMSSITGVLGKEDAAVFVKFKDPENTELYYTLKRDINAFINDVKNFDYVCLVPNGSLLNSNTRAIFDEYQSDRDDGISETYLPLVNYKFELKGANEFVILNKHIWNSAIASTAGVLDTETALKQIDSTIFGAFIPVDDFFNEEYYKKGLRFYQQYHILNHLSDGESIVIGIPKIVVVDLVWDFVLEKEDEKLKSENFQAAREHWVKKNEEAASVVKTDKIKNNLKAV